MAKWIVVDLDGTLCDCAHRVHLAQAKQWDEFHKGIAEDKVREDVATFLDITRKDLAIRVLLCTGRNEQYRIQTLNWLQEKRLWDFDAIVMRPKDNHESDYVLKVRLVDEFFGGRAKALDQVAFVLDDRDRVVQSFRDAGYRCWQVAAGAY
jgi:FMN phosphatase YigB (HAD superfamily)